MRQQAVKVGNPFKSIWPLVAVALFERPHRGPTSIYPRSALKVPLCW